MKGRLNPRHDAISEERIDRARVIKHDKNMFVDKMPHI